MRLENEIEWHSKCNRLQCTCVLLLVLSTPPRPPPLPLLLIFLSCTSPVSHLLSLTHTRVHALSYVHISIHIRQRVRRVLCLHHIHQPCPCIHQWVMSLFTSKRISVYMTYESDASVYRSISPYTLSQCMCMTWSVHTWDMTHSYDEIDFFICVTPLFQQWVRGVQATLHLEAIQGEVTPGRHSQKSARYSIY